MGQAENGEWLLMDAECLWGCDENILGLVAVVVQRRSY